MPAAARCLLLTSREERRCGKLPSRQSTGARVQPGVNTMMALSRYRDAILQNSSPERPLVYQPLIPQLLTASYHCILLAAKGL